MGLAQHGIAYGSRIGVFRSFFGRFPSSRGADCVGNIAEKLAPAADAYDAATTCAHPPSDVPSAGVVTVGLEGVGGTKTGQMVKFDFSEAKKGHKPLPWEAKKGHKPLP
jgi:hypothetical protein